LAEVSDETDSAPIKEDLLTVLHHSEGLTDSGGSHLANIYASWATMKKVVDKVGDALLGAWKTNLRENPNREQEPTPLMQNIKHNVNTLLPATLN
jgi:hypothetical protein